jgi:hypothetical protein
MGRTRDFLEARIPLRWNSNMKPSRTPTAGPFGFLNPTRYHLTHSPTLASNGPDAEDDGEEMVPADAIKFRWTSRNNRKGRHELDYIPAVDPATARYLAPESTASLREVIKNIVRMFTCYPVWDISWLVAYIFTIGSLVWIINAL